MRIVFDSQFQADFKRLMRAQPHLKEEVRELIYSIEEAGRVPASYNPHLLVLPRHIYTGYWELHLEEGKNDILVIYHYHDQPVIRFVRIGSHDDLFTGKQR